MSGERDIELIPSLIFILAIYTFFAFLGWMLQEEPLPASYNRGDRCVVLKGSEVCIQEYFGKDAATPSGSNVILEGSVRFLPKMQENVSILYQCNAYIYGVARNENSSKEHFSKYISFRRNSGIKGDHFYFMANNVASGHVKSVRARIFFCTILGVHYL